MMSLEFVRLNFSRIFIKKKVKSLDFEIQYRILINIR
jgi:hypothetical protein